MKPLPSSSACRQRGVTLLMALIALVALSLAALAMVRSIDTGSLVLGNIGFKQDATAAADQATQQAVTWLTVNNASLTTDVVPSGYYASTDIRLDVTGRQLPSLATRTLVDWDQNNCNGASVGACELNSASADAGGNGSNTARYVIFRLCSLPGDDNLIDPITLLPNDCARPMASSATGAAKKGELNYSDAVRMTGTSGPYYRIVVRVRGPRNTTSFTETIVHF